MIKIEVFEHKDWTQAKSDIANKKDRAKYKWCCTKIKLDGLFPRLPPSSPGFGIIHKNSQTCFEFLTIFWWILWNVHPHEKVICCLKDIALFQFFIGQSPYTSSVLKNLKKLYLAVIRWIYKSKLKMNFSQLLIRFSAHTPVSGLSDSSAEYGLDLTLRCKWTFRWTTRFACTADHSIWNAQDKYIEKITVHWENVQYVHLLELPIRKSSCSKSSPVKTHSWRPRQRLRMQRCQELEAVCAARSLTSCSCWCVLKLFALHGSKLCAPISVVCLFICACACACACLCVLVCVLVCLVLSYPEGQGGEAD